MSRSAKSQLSLYLRITVVFGFNIKTSISLILHKLFSKNVRINARNTETHAHDIVHRHLFMLSQRWDTG